MESDYNKVEKKLKFVCVHCRVWQRLSEQTWVQLAVHVGRWCGHANREVHDDDEEFEVEEVTDARGSVQHRFYLVKWKGWVQPTWERARLLTGCQQALDRFWVQREDRPDSTIVVDGEIRCEFCCIFSLVVKT